MQAQSVAVYLPQAESPQPSNPWASVTQEQNTRSQLELLHPLFITAHRIKALTGFMWLFLIWLVATPGSGHNGLFRVPRFCIFQAKGPLTCCAFRMKCSVACQAKLLSALSSLSLPPGSLSLPHLNYFPLPRRVRHLLSQ